MKHFINRRSNPKGKSLGNRQRLLRRARSRLRRIVNQSTQKRGIRDISQEENVSLPQEDVREYRFTHSPSKGIHHRIYPGNREFTAGDRIPKKGGSGGGGTQGAQDGEGEDDFRFTLTKDEFLEFLFEDLALPDLVKRSLKDSTAVRMVRAGYTTTGSPATLNLSRTMRKAHGRRLALSRPPLRKIEAIEEEMSALREKVPLGEEEEKKLKVLQETLDTLKRRRKAIPFLDPVDIRYAAFRPEAKPNTKAVMFCLMDVSGSMTEREKELAKRFFILLNLFLERRYEKTEVVFIRHTHVASEVDEETFFYNRETGGTIVSTALLEMKRVIAERYPTSEWNIYAAQASDGENLQGDSQVCEDLLDTLLPLCQYYAYVEILRSTEVSLLEAEDKGAEMWQAYRRLLDKHSHFSMRRVADAKHIYPAFRSLFSRQRAS